jgi:hypothetical protein
MHPRRPLLIAALGLTGVACSPDTPAAPPTRPTFSRGTAIVDFHRTNKQDWVGAMHNRGLDRLFAGLATSHEPGDMCSQLDALVADPQLAPPEHRGEHSAAVANIGRQSLRSLCPEWVGLASGSVSFAQSITLSPEAEAIIVQLRTANATAVTSTDLADQYNAILPATASLSQGEADVVNAGASIGLSSMQYWEVNYPPVQTNTESWYGDCIRTSTTDLDTSLLTCVGVAQPAMIVPIVFSGTAQFWLAQTIAQRCTSGSVGGLLEVDFEAGIGAAAGAWIFPPAVPVSAPLVGGVVGLASSGGYAVFNSAKSLWCRYHAGGSAATTQKT